MIVKNCCVVRVKTVFTAVFISAVIAYLCLKLCGKDGASRKLNVSIRNDVAKTGLSETKPADLTFIVRHIV